MSEWMSRFIKKHTCFYCEKTVDKKDIFNVKLETAEGPLELKACKDCANNLNEVLKELEDIRNDQGL